MRVDVADEADERRDLPTGNTRTLTWDVTDLRNPVLVHEFFSVETVIDHNQYLRHKFHNYLEIDPGIDRTFWRLF